MNKKDKKILYIAAGIGFLGNLAANFIWNTSENNVRSWIGLISFIGFFLLFYCLSKGWGN